MSLLGNVTVGFKKVFHIPEKNPPYVQVAVTNMCNKNCGMCIRFQVPIEQRHIEFDDFKKIISKCQGAKSITLVGMGEPLLYPQIIDAIKYCKQQGLITRITTNGILLRKMIEPLIDAGLDIIHISIESIQQADLLEDILKIKEIRSRPGKNFLEIVLQPILFEDPDIARTIEDVYRIIEWAGENQIDKINLPRVDLRTDTSMKRPSIHREKEIFAHLAKYRRRYKMRIDCLQDQVYIGVKGFLYKKLKNLLRLDSFCYRLLDYMYVDVNGNVHPCPIDMDQVMGNILQGDLKDIWHGRKFKAIRRNQNSFRFCKECDFLKLKQIIPSVGNSSSPSQM